MGSSKGVISVAQGVKITAEVINPGWLILRIAAPDSDYVVFSTEMDAAAARLKRQVEGNVVGITGADNETSYVFVTTSVGSEVATIVVFSGGAIPSRTPTQVPTVRTTPLPQVAKTLPIPKVTDPKLGNIVNDLYKGAKGPNPIGTGSTADAVRNELATGLSIHGRFHSQKAQEYINALNNWLRRNPNASEYDRLVAESLKRDLQNALGGN